MNHCRNCGAEVPPEKAWCPQCNEPVEPEARRTVEREMDSFAGTLIKHPKPRPADAVLTPRPPAPVAEPSPLPTPAPVATPPTAVLGRETGANPAIATGSMPAIANDPGPAIEPPPTAVTAPLTKKDNSRLVIYVAVGLGLGLALLVVMIVIGIILWNSSAR